MGWGTHSCSKKKESDVFLSKSRSWSFVGVCSVRGRATAPGERRWDQGDWGPGGRRPREGTRALLLLGHLCFLLPLFPPPFWSFSSSSSLGAGAAPPPGRLPPSQLTPRSSLASPPLSPKVAAGRRRAAHFQALGRQGKAMCVF